MTMDNQRLLLYFLYAIGLVFWYVLWKFSGQIVELLAPGKAVFGIQLPTITAFLALGIAVFVVEFIRRNQKANNFGIEVIVEMKKVSFPNRKELQGSTLVVLIMTIIVTIFLWICDKIFDFALGIIF